MFKIKKLFFIILIVCFSFCIINSVVLADDPDPYGLNTTANTGYSGDAPFKDKSIAQTIGAIVGAGLSFIGVIFLILMIYGGFTWMMARGNQQTVDKAKDLIYSAVIGLIIVLAAYAITAFVGSLLN
jgi:amino acid transporter